MQFHSTANITTAVIYNKENLEQQWQDIRIKSLKMQHMTKRWLTIF